MLGEVLNCSGRMVLLLSNSLLLYMLTGNNVHMKQSRFGAYLKQFVWFYGSVLTAIIVDFVFGLSVISLVSKGVDHTALMSQTWYWIVNIAMQLAYGVQITCTTATAGYVFTGSDTAPSLQGAALST